MLGGRQFRLRRSWEEIAKHQGSGSENVTVDAQHPIPLEIVKTITQLALFQIRFDTQPNELLNTARKDSSGFLERVAERVPDWQMRSCSGKVWDERIVPRHAGSQNLVNDERLIHFDPPLLANIVFGISTIG